jgi:hypothetical protein
MTAPSRVSVVAPLLLSTSRPRGTNTASPGARRVPLPTVVSSRRATWTYEVAAVDDRGRIAASQLLHRMGCQPGTAVAIREHGGLLVVTADPAGAYLVTPRGWLRVPASVRRRYGLVAGSRVLVVADSEAGRLVIHPPVSVDAMIAGCYAPVFGDGAP